MKKNFNQLERAIKATELRKKAAVQWRREGNPLSVIADALGITRARAWQIIKETEQSEQEETTSQPMEGPQEGG